MGRNPKVGGALWIQKQQELQALFAQLCRLLDRATQFL